MIKLTYFVLGLSDDNMKLLNLNKLYLLCLVILPLCFFFAGANVKNQITHYDLNSVDAEMAYLYNGLMITQGWICHFVDHPGIPLQYISAGVICVVNIFRKMGRIISNLKNRSI